MKCLTRPIDMVGDGWADTGESKSKSRVDGNEMGWESRIHRNGRDHRRD